MSSNYTKNYSLCQWEADDQVLREDFNEDNAKIDAAIKSEATTRASAVASLTSQIAKRGNCSIGFLSYVGDGQYGEEHPTVVRFPRMPAAYIIAGAGLMVGKGGDSTAPVIYSFSSGAGIATMNTNWSGSTLSFHMGHSSAATQLNVGKNLVIAFYAED